MAPIGTDSVSTADASQGMAEGPPEEHCMGWAGGTAEVAAATHTSEEHQAVEDACRVALQPAVGPAQVGEADAAAALAESVEEVE